MMRKDSKFAFETIAKFDHSFDYKKSYIDKTLYWRSPHQSGYSPPPPWYPCTSYNNNVITLLVN